MSCKNPWNAKFLVENLNRSFVDTDYKKHRKNLLVDREISRTPDLMHLVERTKTVEEKNIELAALTEEFQKVRKLMNDLSIKVSVKKSEINRIVRGDGGGEAERKKFIMPCPGDTCKGYLSTQYKCELCKLYTCPDCFEIIGYTKEDAHTCKEDNLKSAEMIKKETKGCPKCGVRIFKISGCFAADTPILMYDGNVKCAKDVIVGDQLIGDDGTIRNVTHLTGGYDNMYNVKQKNGLDYMVNSEHMLVVYCAVQGSINYIKSIGLFKFLWFDTNDYKFKSKNFASEHETNDFKLELINSGVDLSCIINIPIKEYIALPDSRKSQLKGIRFSGNIDWKYIAVELDPYILGTWLGDGYSNGKEFCSNDLEIVEYWKKWAQENNAQVVETTNPYRYYIKNMDNVVGEYEKKYFPHRNPLKEKLEKYNLVKNKHIPNQYLINSADIRLKVLAGIIDTDGCVQNNGRRITIISVLPRLTENIKFLAKSLGFNVNVGVRKRSQEIICGKTEPKDYKDQYIINISGENLHIIPTILVRKKCIKQVGGVNLLCGGISVESVGYDNYYGWTVDKNHRFLLGDFTIAKNCDQMWCTECRVAFSWNSGKIVESGAIHNPHYYNFLREHDGGGGGGGGAGAAPRNPGDVLCGGLIPFYLLNSLLRQVSVHCVGGRSFEAFIKSVNVGSGVRKLVDAQNITSVEKLFTMVYDLHRFVNHTTNADLGVARNKVRDLINHDKLVVEYILNKKTKDELAMAIFRNDNMRKKYVELLNVYELLSVVGIEQFNKLQHTLRDSGASKKSGNATDQAAVFNGIIEMITEYNNLIDYCNKQFVTISYTYNHSVNMVCVADGKYNVKSRKFKQSEVDKIGYEESGGSGGKKGIKGKTGITGKNNHEASSSSAVG